MAYKVFISHSSHDAWVAKQLKKCAEEAGATVFLDSENILVGDDFREKIKANLPDSRELIALLTPAAVKSRYVDSEIAIAWALGLRISAVLYGVGDDEIHPLINDKNLYIQINNVDDYFEQLSKRIKMQSS
jgi:hypothetical protein